MMEVPPQHSPKVSEYLRACLLRESIPSRQFWVIGSDVEQEVVRSLSAELLTQSLILGTKGPMFDDFKSINDIDALGSTRPVEELCTTYETLLGEAEQSCLVIFSDWLAENFSLVPVIEKIFKMPKFERLIFVEFNWFKACSPVFKNENDSYSRKDLYDELLGHLSNASFDETSISAEFCSIKVFWANINGK